MDRILTIAVIGFLLWSCSDKKESSGVKELLVQQLKNSHTNQDWFVPTSIALEGLTAEQSNWKDSTANHSIAELVSHLIFWNETNLTVFKGDSLTGFDDNNELTFKKFNETDWKIALEKLDSVQAEWEKLTAQATDEQIDEWSTEIASMSAHNAYHTGQIIYIRKQNGWWPEK